MSRFGGTGAQYVEGTKKSTVPFCNSVLGVEVEGAERYSGGAKEVQSVSKRVGRTPRESETQGLPSLTIPQRLQTHLRFPPSHLHHGLM
jgi:hypothetical protein